MRPFSSLLLTVLLAAACPISACAAGLPPAPAGAFSIVVIPDTQHYKGTGTKSEKDSKNPLTNKVFDGFTDWIAGNLDRQRIVFVSHVGDIVDKNNREQWALARHHMDKLHGRVPYGISVGNHDMITGSGDSSLFQEVFPKSRFERFDWYGGSFTNPGGKQAVSGNNANSFQLFTAGGKKFVFLHLECNAPDPVLLWADSVLKKHADRRALITTHMGWGPEEKPKKAEDYFDAPKGRMKWKKCHGKNGNTPQQMWDKCFSRHRNVFMICSGDQSRTQAYRHVSQGIHGNRIHELLSDYGAYGLRVMRFIPGKNQIEVRTWDPTKGKLCEGTKVVKDRDQHQFTLGYAMSPAGR
jgi:hypothetical protein